MSGQAPSVVTEVSHLTAAYRLKCAYQIMSCPVVLSCRLHEANANLAAESGVREAERCFQWSANARPTRVATARIGNDNPETICASHASTSLGLQTCLRRADRLHAWQNEQINEYAGKRG